MRRGGAYGFGVSSKGESVVVPESVAREKFNRERVNEMAERNRKAAVDRTDPFAATPGARAAAGSTVERPLQVGPPDALIESQRTPSDFVPDIDTKGYHTGVVRQPVEPVPGGFVSEHESKFAGQPTIADMKAAHNEAESDPAWSEGVQRATPTLSERELVANGVVPQRGGRRYAQPAAAPAPAPSVDEKLTGDALEEAGAELKIEGWSDLNADQKREAVAQARSAQ